MIKLYLFYEKNILFKKYIYLIKFFYFFFQLFSTLIFFINNIYNKYIILLKRINLINNNLISFNKNKYSKLNCYFIFNNINELFYHFLFDNLLQKKN
jgi:hypothetical protein